MGDIMDASNAHGRREIEIETIKRDLVELQDALDAVRRRSANVVQQQIHDQPFQSIALAFAAGFIVSRFLAHKLF
ncbi:MAG TPA: hypothetical protein VN656_14020 [Stellaceae bacterium]|nr:hypothetical protein [Stellaceae bacterium]